MLSIVYLECCFAVFKETIAKSGRIRFDHTSEEASSRFNKEMNQGHEAFITGRRTNNINQKYIVVGILHKLPD